MDKFKDNRLSLYGLVTKEKKTDSDLRRILDQKREPLWIPSKRSFFIIAGVIGVFVFLTNYSAIWNHIWDYIVVPIYQFTYSYFGTYIFFQTLISFLKDFFALVSPLTNEGLFKNIVSIHAGIGAVLIGLAFFVAQSLIDKNDPDKGRVLLYKSNFFPLLTAEILAFLVFITGKENIFAALAVVAIGLFTIQSLGKTIRILIKDHEMEKAKTKMFFDILKNNFIKMLDFETTKRFGDNILFGERGEKIGTLSNGFLELSPIGAYPKDNYIEIKSGKNGLITDISFKKIESLIQVVKDIERKNRSIEIDIDSSDQASQQGTNTRLSDNPYIYLIPRFYEPVSQNTNLLELSKDIFPENKTEIDSDVAKIRNLVDEIFEIEKDPEITQESRLEISKIKDRCFKAIKEEQTGELSKISKFYVDLVKEFIDFLDLYGGGFSSIQAEQESSSIFNRLKPIEWIARDIREIFEIAMQSNNRDLIRLIAYLPISLAHTALANGEHLVFQKFIYFPQLLYSYGYEKKSKNKDLSEFMIDRAWRYLDELANYHLKPLIRKNNLEKGDIVGFAKHLLLVYQALIKASFDNGDYKNFCTYLTKSLALFRRFSEYSYKPSDTHDQLVKLKQEVHFGIASWIFYKFENSKTDNDLERFYIKAKSVIPTDIIGITEVFLRIHTFDADDFWGWHWWESNEKSKDDGEVYSIDIISKTEKLYAVLALNSLEAITEGDIEGIILPYNREFASLADGSRSLIKTLEEIQENPEYWSFVINEQAVKKIDKFRLLLKKVVEAQDVEDRERIRAIDISPEKVREFKENVLEDFYNTASIRSIFYHYKLFQDKTTEECPGDLERLGISQIFDKEPFFPDSVEKHIHYVGFDGGFDYGRAIINGENRRFFELLSCQLKTINASDFENTIEEKIGTSTAIVFCINENPMTFFGPDSEVNNYNYTPEWNLKSEPDFPKPFCGFFQIGKSDIPVFQFYTRETKSMLIAFDTKKLGKIIQYNPLEKNSKKHLKEDIFSMEISDFGVDSDLLNKYLDNPPDWLKEKGDQEKQEEHLRERVVISIFEKFEIQLDDKINGFKIDIEQ